MAFVSPGNTNFVAVAPSFRDLLGNAPPVKGAGALTQAVAANQQANLQLMREGLANKALLEAKREEFDSLERINKQNIEANQDTAKKQAAMRLLSGMGSLGGGVGGNRFAGDALAGLLNDEVSSPTQQLQEYNEFLNQWQKLEGQIGNAGLGTSLAYTSQALKGMQ